MDVRSIIDEHVRGKLEDSFGKAVAMMIFASATTSAGVPIIEPGREDYMRLVEAICADPRVVDMWGRTGAQDTARSWRSLAG